MGRAPRLKPLYLGGKLLRVRLALGLSQDAMGERLGIMSATGVTLGSAAISDYEIGQRDPPLPMLVMYARLANVHLEVLADDDLDLPEELPSRTTHSGTKHSRVSPEQAKASAKKQRRG